MVGATALGRWGGVEGGGVGGGGGGGGCWLRGEGGGRWGELAWMTVELILF